MSRAHGDCCVHEKGERKLDCSHGPPSMLENAELPGRPRGEHMIVKHAAVNSYCGGGSDLAPEAWTSWRRRILIARRKRKLQLHDGRLLGMG
jgi:hypothetical protein